MVQQPPTNLDRNFNLNLNLTPKSAIISKTAKMAGNSYYKYILDGMKDRAVQESVPRYGRYMDLYQDFSSQMAAADVPKIRREPILARNLWRVMCKFSQSHES